MKIFRGFAGVVFALDFPQSRAGMYTERGVGEYGIRFSHFCGPILSDEPHMGRLSFGMNEIHMQATSLDMTVNQKISYHISRGGLSTHDIRVSMPFSEKVVSFLKIVAPALNIPLAHEVDYVEARLDQRLRILLVQFPSIASPVVFSSKFCNYDALDESVGHRDHQWSVPNRPSNTSQHPEDGVYSGRVLTPIGSKIVIMKISTDEVGSKSVCFGVRQPGILKCIPLRVEREILMFDSTFPEYVEIMNSLFIKKWSNHLLIYDAYYRSMRWKIGWNDYSFVLGKGASESRERKLVGNILPATGTWYCAKHDKFSLIRLRIEDHYNLLQFMYKLSYSFPWSTRSVRLEALRSGAAFWIDHTNPAISELLSGISAKETVDFVHLVFSPNKRRLYLTTAESPTLVFMNC